MICCSTGGFPDEPGWRVARRLAAAGARGVELSGGAYDEDMLARLKESNADVELRLHNYFPPPEHPFVFNLASLNDEIRRRSLDHATKAIRWSAELGSPVFSFHGGFLYDPGLSELGKPFEGGTLYDRTCGRERFLESVEGLAVYGRAKGVSLLIENNVLTASNRDRFDENPLLMVDVDQCEDIISRTPDNVRLLVDVAHLKVSAVTLGFDPVEFLSECRGGIGGYHLSDNDGRIDDNRPVTPDSWFWSYLKPDLEYYCLEVYGLDPEDLVRQVEMARDIITC